MIGDWEDGWAVVPVGTTELCFTSAPKIIGEGTLWQIYKTERDARDFCECIRFSDVEYEVMPVRITTPIIMQNYIREGE